MLRIVLPGKRERESTNRLFMDVVKDDMAEVEVTEEDTEYINYTGDGKSAVATPDWKSRKKKNNKFIRKLRPACHLFPSE